MLSLQQLCFFHSILLIPFRLVLICSQPCVFLLFDVNACLTTSTVIFCSRYLIDGVLLFARPLPLAHFISTARSFVFGQHFFPCDGRLLFGLDLLLVQMGLRSIHRFFIVFARSSVNRKRNRNRNPLTSQLLSGLWKRRRNSEPLVPW